jgi:hypothetical protein
MVAILRAWPGGIHSIDDFRDAVRAQYPDCSTGVIRQGETVSHNAGVETELSCADRMDATEQKVAAQAQVTRQLRDQREAAARAVLHVQPCENPKTCEALFQAVTAPALLAGRVAQADLVGTVATRYVMTHAAGRPTPGVEVHAAVHSYAVVFGVAAVAFVVAAVIVAALLNPEIVRAQPPSSAPPIPEPARRSGGAVPQQQ